MECVADYVNQNFKTSSIFKKYKIDFCCNGHLKLKDVCDKKNVDYQQVINEINNLEKSEVNELIKYMDIKSLVHFIVDKHHRYLKENLPLIEQFAKKVRLVHGNNHPELIRLYDIFLELKKDLEEHLKIEENELFSDLDNLSDPDFFRLKQILKELESDHKNLGQMLSEIRELTNSFKAPEGACRTYTVLFQYLEDMESDIHMHVHLENNVLHKKIEEELMR